MNDMTRISDHRCREDGARPRTANAPRIVAALALGALCATATAATGTTSGATPDTMPTARTGTVAAMPAVTKVDGVEIVSGGVGSEQARAMQRAASQWPLEMEFALRTKPRAEFVADVDVTVLDAKGRRVLHTVSQGPLMLARLEPGRYELDASLNGHVLRRHVVVRPHSTTRTAFTWPASDEKHDS